MADANPKGGDVGPLRRWAISGAGKNLFQWGTPGDFDRCVAFYKAKTDMSDHMVKGFCASLHKAATGAPPGHAPGEKRHKGP